MRILIHDFGGYPFCLELSREIARRGHNVQHVFFPGACESMRNMEPHADDPPTLEIVPVGVGLPYSKYSLIRRRFQEVAVGKHLARHIEQWRPDIVVSANAPLDVQKQAIRAAHKADARFVFWLQDLISVAMGEILQRRLGLLGRLVAGYYRKVERSAARESDAIVCISEDFLPLLRQWGIAEQRCTVIENWAPKDHIRPLPKDNPWSRAHGLHDKTVFLYSGRLGLKHNPQLMLELAAAHRDRPDIAVVVVAEGLGADWLAGRKSETDAANLLLLPFQPYSDLPHVLASADVLVCIIEAGASRYSVPSKILSYLCAGRTVLAAMPKENLNARHIARIGAGMVVDPDQPQTLLSAARTLHEDADFRDQCANRARAYAEETFDIEKIADRFMAVMTGA